MDLGWSLPVLNFVKYPPPLGKNQVHMIVTFNGDNSITLYVKKCQLKITRQVDAFESTGCDFLHCIQTKRICLNPLYKGRGA